MLSRSGIHRAPSAVPPHAALSGSLPIDTQRSQDFVGHHVWAFYVLVTFTVLFVAGNTVVGRAIYLGIPPITLVFWQSSVALLVLAPFLLVRYRRHWRLIAKHWKLMTVLGLTQVVLGEPLRLYHVAGTTLVRAGDYLSSRESAAAR